MSQHQKYEAGEGEEWRDFYTQHRGGAGNVIMVTVFPPNSDFHGASVGLFSCIETAEKWAATFPDDHPTSLPRTWWTSPITATRQNNDQGDPHGKG